MLAHRPLKEMRREYTVIARLQPRRVLAYQSFCRPTGRCPPSSEKSRVLLPLEADQGSGPIERQGRRIIGIPTRTPSRIGRSSGMAERQHIGGAVPGNPVYTVHHSASDPVPEVERRMLPAQSMATLPIAAAFSAVSACNPYRRHEQPGAD